MVKEMPPGNAEITQMLGDLLSMLVPNCDFVLVVSPEKTGMAFAITNLDPPNCLKLVESFVETSQDWKTMSSGKPN